MLSIKQKATLRAYAHTLEPVVIIGKDGLTEEVVESIKLVLSKRELIKIKLLKNCSVNAKEVMQKICEVLNAQAVQCIGGVIVIYKKSKKEGVKHIEF